MELEKVGCPAAHGLFSPAMRRIAPPHESLITITVPGDAAERESKLLEQLEHFWKNDSIRVLALIPEQDANTQEQLSGIFRDVVFSLSISSHQLFQRRAPKGLALDATSVERANWALVHDYRFEIDQLRLLQVDHGVELWKYLSHCVPIGCDLLAAYPTASSEVGYQELIVFAVAPFYPKYPEHLRHSAVPAVIVNKSADILALSDGGEMLELRERIYRWSERSATRFERSVFVLDPPPSTAEICATERAYLRLRENLAREKQVRPLELRDEDNMRILVRDRNFSREFILEFLHKKGISMFLKFLEFCHLHKVYGDDSARERISPPL